MGQNRDENSDASTDELGVTTERRVDLQKILDNTFHAITRQNSLHIFDPSLVLSCRGSTAHERTFCFGGVNLAPGMGPTAGCRFSCLERGEVAAGRHIARYPVATQPRVGSQ